MPGKPCVKCKIQPKRAGHPKWCEECWLAAQPAPARERAADWRLAAVPESLRRSRVPESAWPPGRRWCSGCQTFVRFSDCGKNASRCRACAGRTAHSGMLARTYSIHGRPFTEADYQALFTAQGGKCRTCGAVSKTKRLAVDHDHGTGEVRGLLCPGEWGCNLAVVGNIENRGGLATAEAIVAYLRSNYAHTVIDK